MTDLVIRPTTHRPRANRHSGDALSRFIETLRTWRKRSRERSELASLNEYQLHDIGLSRSMIAVEIEKPFWQA
jgi:uncharacterized protein YjiS (DUF1127 family)